jgi:hypothetical protein
MQMAAKFEIDHELDTRQLDPRQGDRRKILLPARALCSGRSVAIHLLDLSKKGALIDADTPQMPGEMIWVLSNGLDILSRVVWSRGGRFGVAFESPLNDVQFNSILAANGKPRILQSRSRRRDWLRWFRS